MTDKYTGTITGGGYGFEGKLYLGSGYKKFVGILDESVTSFEAVDVVLEKPPSVDSNTTLPNPFSGRYTIAPGSNIGPHHIALKLESPKIELFMKGKLESVVPPRHITGHFAWIDNDL
ncbi:hypothetical protein APHAL10511_000561 [Amanita phalloides]|nr:hypothetical protein APHAL10511_000561 [Amanita phalloides]